MDKVFKLHIAYIIMFFSSHTLACEHGFFPDNTHYLLGSSQNAMNIQAYSTVVIEKMQKLYEPIFAKNNKQLIIDIQWDEAKVNAYATTDDNNNPLIRVTGGMANHELLTPDGLALILCHEVGHFLGGEPKKLRGRSTKRSWSSAEGQADYYANAVCLKKLFKLLPEFQHVADAKSIHDSNEKSNNSTQSRYINEINQLCDTPLCHRIALASLNVAKVYATTGFYERELSLIYPDESTVYQTLYSHPGPQCRLDTLIAALRCENSEELTFKLNDPISGACDEPDFRRPRCWYYPDQL